MERITINKLESLLDSLNKLDNSTEYNFGKAYDGIKLESNKGSVDVLHIGYVSKRALYNSMHTYIKGLYKGLELK